MALKMVKYAKRTSYNGELQRTQLGSGKHRFKLEAMGVIHPAADSVKMKGTWTTWLLGSLWHFDVETKNKQNYPP